MLYFVATPIGNLGDVSFRAIETLKSVDFIFCEDTRHSRIFLEHYGIEKTLRAYHKFNETACAENICAILESGKNVAVISDAGTPVVSDPGNVLAKILIERGLEFTVIPGACAFVPAMILSGLDSARFSFIGFLPDKKKDAVCLLKKYASLPSPLIFYVPPHDIDDVIKIINEVLGDRKAVAVREITKIHEERTEFRLADGYSGEKRGEFVLVVDGASQEEVSVEDPLEMVNELIEGGLSQTEAVKQVAKQTGMRRNELYKMVLETKGE